MASFTMSASASCGSEHSVPFNLIVKSTFIEVDEGPGLRERDARKRRMKTDSLLQLFKDSILGGQVYSVGQQLDNDSESESESEGSTDTGDASDASNDFAGNNNNINNTMATDIENVEGSSEHSVPFKLIVKSTFIEVYEGPGLRKRAAKLRKMKTDSLLTDSDSESEDGTSASDASDDFEGILTPGLVSTSMPRSCEDTSESESQEQKQKTKLRKDQSNDAALPPTTVMMRNIPNNYSRSMVLALLNRSGFTGRYDFFYLPFDFGRCANLGYAFVNMVDAEAASDFWKFFDGFSQWEVPTLKVCELGWSGQQGLKAHILRYRNSPVMHPNVPDAYKPMLFEGAVRQEFPKPTKKLKPPHPNVRRTHRPD